MTLISSNRGDNLFHNKANAINSFKSYIKPQNHTLLKKGKSYLAVSNNRVSMLKKDGWKVIGRGKVRVKRVAETKTSIRMVRR